MASFDSIINTLIVPIILLGFIYIFRKPLFAFGGWIRDMVRWGKDKVKRDDEEDYTEIPNLKWEE